MTVRRLGECVRAGVCRLAPHSPPHQNTTNRADFATDVLISPPHSLPLS